MSDCVTDGRHLMEHDEPPHEDRELAEALIEATKARTVIAHIPDLPDYPVLIVGPTHES